MAQVFHHQKYFSIVSAWVVLGFHVEGPSLACVGATVEIAAGNDMRMIEAEARGFRRKRNTAHAVRWHKRPTFFGRAIHVASIHLPMPMHESGVSASLYTSTMVRWPSLKRSSGPGNWPL